MLSLDGRTNRPGGEFDMRWIVPHAITNVARDHMVRVASPAATALLGRKNYQGFASYWPGVAENDSADPRDRRPDCHRKPPYHNSDLPRPAEQAEPQ